MTPRPASAQAVRPRSLPDPAGPDASELGDVLAYEREVTRAILDTVGALIVVIDPEARVVAFNKSAE